jgi:hypothetical protein
MKKLFVLALVLTCTVFGLQAQTQPKAKGKSTTTKVKPSVAPTVVTTPAPAPAAPVQPAVTGEGGPKMVFEVETVDYGKIKEGAEPVRIFKFKNTGNEALVITSARGSCGCTVPSYSEKPIQPGETGEIKVRYDTKRLGPFNKQVTLTTNEKESTHLLTIKGEVLKVEEQPGVPAKSGSGVFNNN